MKPLYLTLGLLALMTHLPVHGRITCKQDDRTEFQKKRRTLPKVSEVEEARKDKSLLNLLHGSVSTGMKVVGNNGSVKAQERQDSAKSKPKASPQPSSSTSTSSRSSIYLNSASQQQKLRPSKSCYHSSVILHPRGQRLLQQNIHAQQRKRISKPFSTKISSKAHNSTKSPIDSSQRKGEGQSTQIQTIFRLSKFHSNMAIPGKGAQATMDHNISQRSGQFPYGSRLSAQRKSFFTKPQQFGQSKFQVDPSGLQKSQPKTLIKRKIYHHKFCAQIPAHRKLSQQHNLPHLISQQKTQKKTFEQRLSSAKRTPQTSSQRKSGQQKLQKSTPKKLNRQKNQAQTSAKVNRLKPQTNGIPQEKISQTKLHSDIFIQKRLSQGRSLSQVLEQDSSDQQKSDSQIWTKEKNHKPKYYSKNPVKERTGRPACQEENFKPKTSDQHKYDPQKYLPRIHNSMHFHSPKISQQLQMDLYDFGDTSSMDWSYTSNHYEPNPSVHSQSNSHHPKGNPETPKTKKTTDTSAAKQSTTADKKPPTNNKSAANPPPNTSVISPGTSSVTTSSDVTTTITNAPASNLPVFGSKSAITNESASTPSSATMTSITSASSTAATRDPTYFVPASSPTRPMTKIPDARSTSAFSLPTSEDAMFSLIAPPPFIPDCSISIDSLNTLPAAGIAYDPSISAATRNIFVGAIHADTSSMSLGSDTSDYFDDTTTTLSTSTDSTETTSGTQSLTIPDLTNSDEVSTLSIYTIIAGPI